MADLETDVGILKDWRLKVADPMLTDHSRRVDELETFQNKTEGKFTVIVWLNGIIITLLIGMILALFTWGLSHITLKVSNETVTQSNSAPQDAGAAYPR